MPTSQPSPQDNLHSFLDGMLACLTLKPHQCSICLTVGHAGTSDPLETFRVRSYASLDERAGRARSNRERSRVAPHSNREMPRAGKRLAEDNRVERQRTGNKVGPKSPYRWRLIDSWEEHVAPKNPIAYAAIRYGALHIAPCGPAAEMTNARLWYQMGSWHKEGGYAEASHTEKEWEELLFLTRRTLKEHLAQLQAADRLEVFDDRPLPRSRARQLRVRMWLPRNGKLPVGAQNYQLFMKSWEQEVAATLGAQPTRPASDGLSLSERLSAENRERAADGLEWDGPTYDDDDLDYPDEMLVDSPSEPKAAAVEPPEPVSTTEDAPEPADEAPAPVSAPVEAPESPAPAAVVHLVDEGLSPEQLALKERRENAQQLLLGNKPPQATKSVRSPSVAVKSEKATEAPKPRHRIPSEPRSKEDIAAAFAGLTEQERALYTQFGIVEEK